MALFPYAVQKPVSSHGTYMGTVLGVVEHVTAGEGDPYYEFANPANQVSSHFGIGNGQGGMPDGLIEQYVDTAYMSWAQVAGNGNYISVETEGLPTEPLTPAQVTAFGGLMAWANVVHGVPLVIVDTPGQRGLITHGDGGAAWGGHTGCPGDLRKAQRQAILAAAGATPPPPTPSPGGQTVQVTLPELASGASGPAVSHLQQLLNTHGPIPPLNVDGQYGQATASVVKWFNTKYGVQVLDPTVCIADTWRLVIEL